MSNRPLYLGLLLAVGVATAAPAQGLLTARDSARHVLNRLAYGGGPGEVDSVARSGVQAWIDQQLGYTSVSDPGLRDRERPFDVLQLPLEDLMRMQTDQLARQRRIQAQAMDSAARMRMAAELRRQDRASGRRDLRELLAQLPPVTLVRAVESSHQLDEVLTDFWLNHFNIFINKGLDRALFPDWLERTIRAHALGRFEDLLLATARSPAMLFYLDNVQSVAPGMDMRQPLPGRRVRPTRPNPMDSARLARLAQNAPRGLNENYARELMELHTLGVDGGYTQQDVINVARILTGWGIDRRTGEFQFRAAAHDRGAKTVLGVAFPAGHGEDEGVRLLRMLAGNPATMHHVSSELCARFVADVPPDGCVDDAVRAWKQTNGDIRAVVRAIVASPDFWASANVDNKVKTPLEFVVSAVRAVGGIPDSTPRLAAQVGRLGQPLFQMLTPNGYGETQEDWVNSGALLARMNFAVQLASGRMPGVRVALDATIPATTDHDALVRAVDHVILGGAMSDHTRSTILDQIADLTDPAAARTMAVGLALGGPDFQRQ